MHTHVVDGRGRGRARDRSCKRWRGLTGNQRPLPPLLLVRLLPPLARVPMLCHRS